MDYRALADFIRSRARALGFQQLGITGTRLGEHEKRLGEWLARGDHGSMHYMARHGTMRSRPEELVPNTIRVLSARMDYLPPGTAPLRVLGNPEQAYIARYALGRDYHKRVRRRLAQLVRDIRQQTGAGNFRVFADSAPVLEKGLAQHAGLGWIGKNTLLLNRRAGSWFFLGEIYTDLPLPLDEEKDGGAARGHCGSCRACLDVCPTGAFRAPYQLDARRCISYLTIELRGSIPVELRPLMGNRVFGCDDCQLVCPWNKFARPTDEQDFHPRHSLDAPRLVELFAWEEDEFLRRTAGSPLRRIGYVRWLRNLAVALGNAPHTASVVTALRRRRAHPSPLVREHVQWALSQHHPAARSQQQRTAEVVRLAPAVPHPNAPAPSPKPAGRGTMLP